MHKASLSRRSAIWRPASRWSHAAIPLYYRDWLLDATSLTQRVMAVCTGPFAVRVLSQGWQSPFADERCVLGMRAHGFALVRQVQLRCGPSAWVYARTVIPRASLAGANRKFARLGTRPLGAALFADPTMERGAVEVARITARDALFAPATVETSGVDEIWGRRSVFRVHGLPLLVSEMFLPGIPEAPR